MSFENLCESMARAERYKRRPKTRTVEQVKDARSEMDYRANQRAQIKAHVAKVKNAKR